MKNVEKGKNNLILTKKLIHLFNNIIVFIPLLMAFLLALVYLCGGWEFKIKGHAPNFYFLKNITNLMPCIGFSMIWIVLIAIISVGILRIQKNILNKRLKRIYTCIIIFIIAFGVRFLLLYIFAKDFTPFSDFNASWEIAKGNFEDIEYYSLFPAYLNFSLYENLIISIFGEKYIVILYLNAFYSGITAFIIYLIVYEILNKESVCILAGVIYALYPSNIIYITTGTPEFITILFNSLGILVLMKVVQKDKFKFINIAMCMWGGALLGIGTSFKTFSLVIVIAFIMVITAKLIIRKSGKLKKEIMQAGIVCILMIVGYKISSEIIIKVTSEYFNIKISAKTAVPHFMLIGLNTESEGQIHLGSLSRLYLNNVSNGMNYETAKNYAYTILKEDWLNNFDNILPNFSKKMIWAWQDDYIPVRYFLENSGVSTNTPVKGFVYKFISEYGAGVTQVIYFLVMFLALVGAFSYARLKEINFKYEFIALIIFGYFCMIFLSEGQSRYKCLIMGYVIILSSFGVETLKNIIFWIQDKTLKKIKYER